MNLRINVIIVIRGGTPKKCCFKLSMKFGCNHTGGKEALIYHVRNERGQRRPLYPEIITHLGTGELGEFINPLCLTKTHMYTIYTTHNSNMLTLLLHTHSHTHNPQ